MRTQKTAIINNNMINKKSNQTLTPMTNYGVIVYFSKLQ